MYLDFGKVRVHVSFPFAAVLAYALNTGRGEGLLFKKGKIVRKVPAGDLADELAKMIEEDEEP